MNKQELIEKWESKEGAPSYEISAFPVNPSLNEMYIAGYGVARKEILDDLKQLDKPKKVVLPKTADDFIKEGEGLGSDKVDIIDSAISFARAMPNDKFSLWFKSNRNLFVDALANGYEVEKEQLYYVKLPVVYFNHLDLEVYLMKDDCGEITIADNNEFDDMKFTEQEIKVIDERYWPFAVKVDGE
ncbi:DUF1642 domain-containing protein [Enterococcus faecalis]|jgi:hypothetical protein|uniref:DUF1642 domain-containing protein n=2 Tax=Enterococcus faecalis TaxID=1351 RepID=UPI00027C80E3|nr:DUF1642 domain-containing protein [Enterococcus faecalis]EGO2521364.1 DUF1642 domain-containing protein [Enterococcus faecalis]EHF1088182.1 DUF1642 domain-containing protein [Enterococcus faecalis]EJU88623.1 hypothetical protein HMPREF1328_01731 [Enterococcus faecalis ERV103]EJU91456.1 hypothetical protein HMPREF1329_00328 [Enterococcus faecalis ERV116]NSU23002.1 DUF1642 domain-containing protein [Enterococcus faecalis]